MEASFLPWIYSIDNSILVKIYPVHLPLTSPRVKLNRQRESKTKEEFHLGILANLPIAKFPLENFNP